MKYASEQDRMEMKSEWQNETDEAIRADRTMRKVSEGGTDFEAVSHPSIMAIYEVQITNRQTPTGHAAR